MTGIDMPDQYEGVTEFVGYGPAAEYLGLKRNTLSSYVARGIGPQEKLGADGKPERRVEGQYLLPVFERSKLDAWKEGRPGQGARTDLTPPETAEDSRYNVPAFVGP